MAWKYDRFRRIATDPETGAAFSVNSPTNDIIDIEIVPITGASADWSKQELDEIKQKITLIVQDDISRESLRWIINTHFPGAYADAAGVIARRSGKNVSRRSIQAWLIDPEKPSSRRCPLKCSTNFFAMMRAGRMSDAGLVN